MKREFLNSLWFLVLIFGIFEVEAQVAIKTHENVEIGGITQWIGAKAKDDSKPLLLFLHGGPGFSSRAYSKKFVKHLQNDFIVAQWDQRETGITAHWGPFDGELTLDMFYQDTEEVVRYLLKRFSKRKVFLVGFSWGGFLGLHFAKEHPELVHTYIAVSPMIYGDKSEQLTLDLLKQKAKASGDKENLKELSTIEVPYATWEDLYLQRKWTAHYFKGEVSERSYPKKLFKDWSSKWMPLFLKASKINAIDMVPEIECPIYFFISKNDYVANYLVTENYYKGLKADKKKMIWFEESAHEIPTDEPGRFSEEIIKIANEVNNKLDKTSLSEIKLK